MTSSDVVSGTADLSNTKHILLFTTISRVTSGLVLLIGCTALLGWITNQEVLKSMTTAFPSMKANTAITLSFAGLAVFLSTTVLRDSWVQRILAAIVLLMGSLTLSQYVTGQNLGIDEMFFQDTGNQIGTAVPGRMAANTATLFTLLGLSLLFVGKKVFGRNISQFFLLLAAFVITPTAIGYIYGIDYIFGLATNTKMALPTALAFTLLLISIPLSRNREGFMRIITSNTSGGYLARRIFALVIILPLVIGWIVLIGERFGFYDDEFRFVSLVVLYMFIFALFIWRIAHSLYRLDSERNEIARSLHQSEERYRLLLNNVQDYGIFLTDTKGRITSWNPGIQNILGYAEEEFIGKTASILFTSEDVVHKMPQKEMKTALQKGAAQDKRWHVRKDGSRFYADGVLTVVRDQKGKKIGFTKIFHDITAQQLAEEAQRQKAEILEGITDGFLSFDKNWNFTYVNHEGAKTLGRNAKELLGKNLWTEFPELEETPFGKLYKQVAKEGKPQVYEDYYAPFDSWFAVRVYPSKSGLSLYFQNITARKALEKQKDEFIGMATHELKTPVTSVKAYTQTMIRRFTRANDTLSAELATKMDRQLDKLTNLIGDLLDVTKIDGGKLQFNKNIFDFNALVEEIVEEMQRTTVKHAIHVHPTKSIEVYGDRDRIGQVITNLISNAIKYSPKANSIDISIVKDEKNIQLCVKDYGLGIPKEKLQKVFERFYRVSNPKSMTYPGLGLGLYISKDIIRRHGGKIWVEQNSDTTGSTFCFSLSLTRKSAKVTT